MQKNRSTKRDFISGRECLNSNLSPWIQLITDLYGLVFTIEGTGHIFVDDQSVEAKPGRLLILSPGCTHRFTPQYGWTYLWFHVVLPDRLMLVTPFPEIIRGVESLVKEQGYKVILCHSNESSKQETDEIEQILKKHTF